MPGIQSRPYLSLRARLVREDDGFGLIEVMVSAILVVGLALATFKLLDATQQVSANNRSRDIAAQIAQSEQDAIRQLPIEQLAGGYHVEADKAVGTLTYHYVTDAEWVTDSGGPVTCSTSGSVAYLATTTTVTWPNMGATRPVTADAIVDPGVAAVGAKKGALTVLLSRADGTGAPNVIVTVDGISATTDENGCAVIGNLDVGPQTLTYADPNFVDKNSVTAVSKPVTIGAGTIAQTTGYYDNPGRVNLTTPVDTSVVGMLWNSKYSIDHDQRDTPSLFTVQGATGDPAGPATVPLFPFASQYRVYAGDCTGNNPSKYGGANQGVAITRGNTQDLTVDMYTSTVTVNWGNIGTGAKNVAIVMEPDSGVAAMSGCTQNFTYNATASSASGNQTYKFQTPVGVYKVCAFVRYGSSSPYTYGRVYTTFGTTPPQSIVATNLGSGTYKQQLTTTLTPPSSGTSGVNNMNVANCP